MISRLKDKHTERARDRERKQQQQPEGTNKKKAGRPSTKSKEESEIERRNFEHYQALGKKEVEKEALRKKNEETLLSSGAMCG